MNQTNPFDKAEFVRRIRLYCTAHGITQAELARRMNIEPCSLAHRLSRPHTPTVPFIVALAKATGIPATKWLRILIADADQPDQSLLRQDSENSNLEIARSDNGEEAGLAA